MYTKGVTALKATGIVVEYNPFHNGHNYHATEARKLTNADVVIAVMSGNFLQRGEPAFVDKWTRTKMALQNGVDLVIELPYAFATCTRTNVCTGSHSNLRCGPLSMLFVLGVKTAISNHLKIVLSLLRRRGKNMNKL